MEAKMFQDDAGIFSGSIRSISFGLSFWLEENQEEKPANVADNKWHSHNIFTKGFDDKPVSIGRAFKRTWQNADGSGWKIGLFLDNPELPAAVRNLTAWPNDDGTEFRVSL